MMSDTNDAATMTVRYQMATSRYRRIEGREPHTVGDIQRRLDRARGKTVLYNSLLVNERETPPLVSDPDNYDFFRAVVQQKDGVLDIEPDKLEALRRYVLDGNASLLTKAFPADSVPPPPRP
jgi:hypothetical protein